MSAQEGVLSGLTCKPTKGNRIGWHNDDGVLTYFGEVTHFEGNLCWLMYPDGEQMPFIWRNKNGLNLLATVMA